MEHLVTELLLVVTAQAGTGSAPPAKSAPPLGASWQFRLEPLLWVPSLSGDGSADGSSNVDLDRSFADTFGELDAGFLLMFEAKAPGSRFSLLADGLYVRFHDEDGRVHTDSEIAMTEFGAGAPIGESDFEAIAGLRYVALSLDLDTSTVDATSSTSWVDPWFGARWRREFADGWWLALRGDVGGFGIGSDFTWQAIAAVSVELGDHVAFDVGYRALSLDFDDDDLGYDVLAYGPWIGLAFRW